MRVPKKRLARRLHCSKPTVCIRAGVILYSGPTVSQTIRICRSRRPKRSSTRHLVLTTSLGFRRIAVVQGRHACEGQGAETSVPQAVGLQHHGTDSELTLI